MCTFQGAREVTVCDVAIASVRSRVAREVDGVEFIAVPGSGTLVTAPNTADGARFKSLVEAGIDDALKLG